MSEAKGLNQTTVAFSKLSVGQDDQDVPEGTVLSESKSGGDAAAAQAKGHQDGTLKSLFDLGSECCICLDEIAKGRALFAAECGHVFHFGCLQQNVDHDEANASRCPLCRQAMSEYPMPSKGANRNVTCAQCSTRYSSTAFFCTSCGSPNPAVRGDDGAQRPDQQLIVSCPRCSVRMMFPVGTAGQRRCPAGHLFQIAPPAGAGGAAPQQGGGGGGGPGGPIYRRCPTCRVHLQIPPGSPSGLYACPHGHQFQYQA